MIFNIAVVEDEKAESDALVSLLERYRKEYQMSFSYKCFENVQTKTVRPCLHGHQHARNQRP